MGGKLRQLPGDVILECERFEVELDAADYAAFAENPEAVIRRLIAEAGAPAPNGVIIPASLRERDLRSVGTLKFVHVKAPASLRSNYILVEHLK